MVKNLRIWQAFAHDRRAVTALEYALIAGIAVLVITAGFGVFAGDLAAQFGVVGAGVQASAPSSSGGGGDGSASSGDGHGDSHDDFHDR